MRRIIMIPLALALIAQNPAPIDAQPAPGSIRLASSGTHTLVVAPDGTVMCQGRNQYNVCSSDPVEYVANFSPVAGLPKARAVAIGEATSSMVLGDDGKVYVWGQNPFGLFGGTDRGPVYVRAVPTPIAGLGRARDIAALDHGGAALLENGTVWMWGEDVEGLMGGGTLTKSWENGRKQFTPAPVSGLDGVVQIAAGQSHMLALRNDGTVWAWGANKRWQLGVGDHQARARPTRVPSLNGVTRILAEAGMSAARLSNGTWVVWGAAPSTMPETDNGRPSVETPSPLPGLLRDAVDLANGVALFRDGTVRTWGGNDFGSLGTGAGVDAVASAPRAVLVRSLAGVIQVWAGNNRSAALRSDGTLLMWGPSGSNDVPSFRVPKALATLPLSLPR